MGLTLGLLIVTSTVLIGMQGNHPELLYRPHTYIAESTSTAEGEIDILL